MMEGLVDWMLQLSPIVVQTVSYLVIFLTCIIEGVPPFWFLVPCWLILMVGGFLANIGQLPLCTVLIFGIIGAFIGEILSYEIGNKYGMKFLQKMSKILTISDTILDNITSVVKKRFVLGMFISKLYGRARGIIPFVAGMSKVKYTKFLICSALSIIVWAFLFTLIGYFLGESYVLIVNKIWTLLTRSGIIAGVVIVSLWIMKSKYNYFSKSFTLISLIAVFALLALGVISQKYQAGIPLFVDLDLTIIEGFFTIPRISQVAQIVSQLFSFSFLGILGIILIFLLYRKKMLYQLSVFFSTMVSCVFAFPLVKNLVRGGQGSYEVIFNDFGFPSGNAMMSLTLCILLRYLFHGQIKRKFVSYLLLVCALMMGVTIGTASIMQHTYKCTDLIGGFLLGIVVLTLNILLRKILFQRHKNQKKRIERSSKKQLIDLLIE